MMICPIIDEDDEFDSFPTLTKSTKLYPVKSQLSHKDIIKNEQSQIFIKSQKKRVLGVIQFVNKCDRTNVNDYDMVSMFERLLKLFQLKYRTMN